MPSRSLNLTRCSTILPVIARPGDEDADGQDAHDLSVKAAAAEDADRQGAPDSGHQMDRDGADHVVDLELVQDRHREPPPDSRRCRRPISDRQQVVLQIRPGGDRDQAGDRAVKRHGQVDLLVDQLGDATIAASTPPAARQIGVDVDDGNRRRVQGTKPRASWEPPLKPNQPNHRTKVPRWPAAGWRRASG